MNIRTVTAVAALLVLGALLPGVQGHVFNLKDRHEVCEIYGDPNSDYIGDGHEHTHDAVEAAYLKLHNHDPCKQISMRIPTYGVENALEEVSLVDAAFPDNDPDSVNVIVGQEAFKLPVSKLNPQTSLSVSSEAVLKGMGFPGKGTAAEPYIIEGYAISNLLSLKDTSSCVVLRNNVVQGRVTQGPIVDITRIVDLQGIADDMEMLHSAALDTQSYLRAERETRHDTLEAALDEQATKLAELAEMAGVGAEWDAAYDAYASAYAEYVGQVDKMADELAAYVATYTSAAPPPETYHALLGDMDMLQPAFESYMADLEAFAEESAPATADYKEGYDALAAELQAKLDDYAADLLALQPDDEAFMDFLTDQETLQDAYDAFLADTLEPAQQAYEDLMDEWAAKMPIAEADLRDYAAWAAKASDWAYEYLGEAGDYLYNTKEELVTYLMELLGIDEEDESARMVLDWNGQCVHAFHNIVGDLRVNQNNDRLGYATGGVIEANRFYTIGQIRHYDGEFRGNEVGDRDHLRSLVDENVEAPANDRSINGDGFNEANFHDNLIFGQVDLDLHGHHHSPGFFAPESHYHGSDNAQKYMKNPDGSWMLDPDGNMMPHHDHTKRWTSVNFADNVIIDPQGVGLRYEDENHRGDDHWAPSENMHELDKPHFHRTWLQLLDNTVVGPVFVDIFNADGVDLWSDTWTEPKKDLTGAIIDALDHLGAEIVTSHPARNDGWIDMKGNTEFLVGGGAAYRVIDTKEIDALDFSDNRAVHLGEGFDSGLDVAGLKAFLLAAGNSAAADLEDATDDWGGEKGMATGFRIADMKTSDVRVCGNSLVGFQKGLEAVDRVYDTSSITSCSDNDWGSADPAVSIEYTPTPASETPITQPLRDITDTTEFKYVVAPVYDTIDGETAVLPDSPVDLPHLAPPPVPGAPPLPSLPGVPSLPVPALPSPMPRLI